jgi:ubiquinone/menaquinone biosynthesis C-methylase UbiE
VLFVLGDAEALPFATRSFDVVACRLAPHHFPHPERFVDEVARVLKPDGRFGVTDNVAPENTAGAAFLDELERLRDPSHVRCLPVHAWREYLRRHFKIVHEERWTKTYEFSSWVERATESEAQRSVVTKALLGASPALKAEFAVTMEEDRVKSFSAAQWMALCRLV